MKINFILYTIFVLLTLQSFAQVDVQKIDKKLILTYEFDTSSIDTSIPMKFREEDGQFEVRFLKDKFPITASKCKKSIIARMPSTINGNKAEIENKKNLFNQINELKSKPETRITLKFDIKPYAKVKKLNPFDGELSSCNVFIILK